MLDALTLAELQDSNRRSAIIRLQTVAREMTFLADQIAAHRGETSLATGPLATATRLAWNISQAALIQAEAGIVCERIIGTIVERGEAPEPLRQLALSCLTAAERRLYGQAPRPVERELRH